MRTRLVTAAVVVLAAIVVAVAVAGRGGDEPERREPPETGTTPPAAGPTTVPPTVPPTATSSAAPDDAVTGRAEALLAELTREQRIGQLFMLAVAGTEIDTPEAGNESLHGVATIGEVVDRWQPGGVIYFAAPPDGGAGNLDTPQQTRALSDAIHDRSAANGVPALIGIDQEHGIVDRLGSPATQFPGAMALAATGDVQLVREVTAAVAEELRAVGVDVNFAPVADLQSNPDNPVIGPRSFGSDPAEVAPFLGAAITGYQQGGVVPVAKHFPGHGDTDVDSHVDLPTVDRSQDTLAAEDLAAFEAAIDAGVPAIMTGHLRVPALDDSGTPSTLSEPIVGGWLRDRLGFDGLVVTDALNMAGARETASDAELPVLALQAGVDLLLMPADTETAVSAVEQAITDGVLDEARVDEAVRRILEVKIRAGLLDDGPPAPSVDTVGSSMHQDVAAEAAQRAVTVIRGECLPPLPDGATVAVVGDPATPAVEAASTWLDAAGYEPVPAVAAADRALVVLGQRVSEGDRRAAAAAADATTSVTLLTGLPYPAPSLNGDVVAAVYGDEPVLGEAAAQLTVGALAPRGTLPVPIEGAAVGHGVTWDQGCAA